MNIKYTKPEITEEIKRIVTLASENKNLGRC